MRSPMGVPSVTPCSIPDWIWTVSNSERYSRRIASTWDHAMVNSGHDLLTAVVISLCPGLLRESCT